MEKPAYNSPAPTTPRTTSRIPNSTIHFPQINPATTTPSPPAKHNSEKKEKGKRTKNKNPPAKLTKTVLLPGTK